MNSNANMHRAVFAETWNLVVKTAVVRSYCFTHTDHKTRDFGFENAATLVLYQIGLQRVPRRLPMITCLMKAFARPRLCVVAGSDPDWVDCRLLVCLRNIAPRMAYASIHPDAVWRMTYPCCALRGQRQNAA
jgi:hypothetical protein